MDRNNIADRFGPRVSNFLSYGIVVFIKIHDFRHSWIFHGSHGEPMDSMGTPWEPMGTPWGPMGTHGNPWIPMGTHGNPWEPMGPMDFPCIFHELSGRPEADKKCGGAGTGRTPHPPLNATEIIMAICCHLMVKLYLNNRFNILIDFFCFILV